MKHPRKNHPDTHFDSHPEPQHASYDYFYENAYQDYRQQDFYHDSYKQSPEYKQLVTFSRKGTEYKLRLLYWNKLIEFAYFQALHAAAPRIDPIKEHDPNFLHMLITKYYSPASYQYYSDLISDSTKSFGATGEQIKLHITEPSFDFASSVLQLHHWYYCELLPDILDILKVLDLSLDTLKAFEKHRDFEYRIKQGRFHDVSDSSALGMFSITRPDVDSAAFSKLHPDFQQVLLFLFSPIAPNAPPRLSFENDAIPVLEALSTLPHHEYLRVVTQCEANIIRAIQDCLPTSEQDPSEIFQDLLLYDTTTTTVNLSWFLEKLQDAMEIISWNYPVPVEYYYLIDSGLLDHPKLGTPITSPERATLLDTYLFHHDLLVKDLQLSLFYKLREAPLADQDHDSGHNDQFERFYRKLFYVFDRFALLNKTKARQRIRELVLSGKYKQKIERNMVQQLIVKELEEYDAEIERERGAQEDAQLAQAIAVSMSISPAKPPPEGPSSSSSNNGAQPGKRRYSRIAAATSDPPQQEEKRDYDDGEENAEQDQDPSCLVSGLSPVRHHHSTETPTSTEEDGWEDESDQEGEEGQHSKRKGSCVANESPENDADWEDVDDSSIVSRLRSTSPAHDQEEGLNKEHYQHREHEGKNVSSLIARFEES